MAADDEAPEGWKGHHAKRIEPAQAEVRDAETRLSRARTALEDRLVEAHDDGLSYAVLGELTGFSKQYVGQLVKAARERA